MAKDKLVTVFTIEDYLDDDNSDTTTTIED